MKRGVCGLLCAALVALLGVNVAAAQDLPFSTSVDVPFMGAVTDPGTLADEYTIDDGSSENALGLTQGGVLAWLLLFQVTEGNETITSLSGTFGTPGCSSPPCAVNGNAFGIGIWSDPNQDGNPSDGALLAKGAGVIADADTDTFVNVDIPDTNVGAVGRRFFLAVWTQHLAGDFPGSMDQGQRSERRAWVTGQVGGTFNPDSFPTTIGWNEMDTIGFPSVWLLRGSTSGGGGGGCQYLLSANSKPKKGCTDCPKKGELFASGDPCDDVKDCAKKLVIKKLDCPDGGPGFCKKVKGKRDSCL